MSLMYSDAAAGLKIIEPNNDLIVQFFNWLKESSSEDQSF